MGSLKTSGLLFKLVPENIHLLGKVLHHDTAYNPSRNEYLVTFDLDVNNDALPDHLYALRFDTLGEIVDRRVLNYTANIENHAGIRKFQGSLWTWNKKKTVLTIPCGALSIID